MSSPKTLNKLPSSRASVQLKNGWLEVLELVAIFLFKTETYDAKKSWEFYVDNIICLVKIRRFRKERDKYKVSLINRNSFISLCIQYKVALLVLRTVFAVCFWLFSFLQLKLLARIPLLIGDSPPTVVLYSWLNFHKCVSVAF